MTKKFSVILALSILLTTASCHKYETASEKSNVPESSLIMAPDNSPKTDVSTNQDVPKPSPSIHQFTVKSWDGKDVPLNKYEGKVILIVNTATACGFTPQYGSLEALYQKYHEKGLEILDFPCNQFGQQAPGNDKEIHDFRTNEYKATFPQFAKIDVNGQNAAPIYQYLVSLKGFAGFDPNSELTPILDNLLSKEHPGYKNTPDIKWNFTKFLFDRSGKFIDRYEPTTLPETLEAKIESLL